MLALKGIIVTEPLSDSENCGSDAEAGKQP
jgi:hypothetical protein